MTAPARLTSRILAGTAERLAPAAETPAPEPELVAGGPVKGDWLEGQAQQLWCELGKHHWARVAVRGRKPTACPEHR